jgi:hypothetical protein
MISPGADAAIAALNEILRIDGGELRVHRATETFLALELDLSNSSCPECVVPKQMMIDILRSNLATADPDIREIDVLDPREEDGYAADSHG